MENSFYWCQVLWFCCKSLLWKVCLLTCLFGKVTLARKGRCRSWFLLISDAYRYVRQQCLSGLPTSPTLQNAQGRTVTTEGFARGNETTWIKSLHKQEIGNTTIRERRNVLMFWKGDRREYGREVLRTFTEWESKRKTKRIWGKMQTEYVPFVVWVGTHVLRILQGPLTIAAAEGFPF